MKKLYTAQERPFKWGLEAGKIKWISVGERLPDKFVSVLVYMPEEAPLPTVREGYLTDAGFMVPSLLYHIPGVTHWAEIPDGPEEV